MIEIEPRPQMFNVPVEGGTLAVARWGTGDAVVVAPHGITANHVEFTWIAAELGNDVTMYAPDLRGRGASAGLPGPWGMGAHARDLVAILDHAGVDKALVAGHSMGGFVAVKTALEHPDRVTSLVLMDGGIALPIPPGLEIDQLLLAVIGPAMERLGMTFASPEDYFEFWGSHPAVGDGHWNELIEAYLAYDIHEVDGEWRSQVDPAAVRGDGEDSLVDEALQTGLPTIELPMTFLWSPRGILDADPLYPWEVVEQFVAAVPSLNAVRLDDVNHYTLALSRQGAKQVAAEIRAALDH